MKAFINACETGRQLFTWFVYFFFLAEAMYGVSRSVDPGGFADCPDPGGPPLPGGFAPLSLPIQQPHCTPTVIGCETFKLNLCGFLWTFLWAEMCEISGKIYPQHKTCSIQSKIWEISIVQNLSRNQFIFWARDGQDSWLKNHCSKMSLTYIKGMKIRVSKLVRCKMPVCAKLALNTRTANVLFMLIGMTE